MNLLTKNELSSFTKVIVSHLTDNFNKPISNKTVKGIVDEHFKDTKVECVDVGVFRQYGKLWAEVTLDTVGGKHMYVFTNEGIVEE